MTGLQRLAQIPSPVQYVSGLIGGVLTGTLFVALALASWPRVALAAVAGAGLLLVLFISPVPAFLLTALVVPLERTGRLTNDSAVYSISVMKLVGVLALASFALHILLARKRLAAPWSVILYGAYTAFGAFTMLYTSDSTGSIRATSLIVGNLLFFIMATNLVRDIGFARTALACWLTANAVIAVITTIQFHSPAAVIQDVNYYKGAGELNTEHRFSMVIYDRLVADGERSKRAIGSTSHPAVYALNLLLALPFYVYFARVPGHCLTRLAAGLGGLVSVYNILLANTRAAIVVLAFTVGVMTITGLVRVTARMLLISALLAAVVLAANPRDVWNRALNLSTYSTRVGVVEERTHMWRAAFSVIGDTWWRGTGIGNQREVPARVRQKVAASSAHNDVLAQLVETGLPGFLLMAAFLVSLHLACRRLERTFRAAQDPQGYWLAVASRILIYILLIYGIQVESLSLPIKGFWLAFGIVAGLSCASPTGLAQLSAKGHV